jgi:putative hydrolase of the HAD superfamily
MRGAEGAVVRNEGLEARTANLVDLILANTVPVEPLEPPSLPGGWKRWEPGDAPASCEALLFDVYGTLFCSAAGDIGDGQTGGGQTGCGRLDGLAASWGLGGKELRRYFRDRVAEIHAALKAKTAYPEVRVEEIWGRFLESRGAGGDAGELALRYELAVNPASPMPGAPETIRRLRALGLVLGIVSNAQFYTPLLFKAFFGGFPEELGFDPGLVFYSFEMGEAKPSPRFYAAAAAGLASRGLKPERCLVVGNDMLNDAAAAMKAGFRAVLFAGDGRSLRLRENLLPPHYIIRSLEDLPLLCGE